MKRRIIELRSGTWEWSVVDPDDPRMQRRARSARARVAAGSGEDAAAEAAGGNGNGKDGRGAPPLPKRRIELRSTDDPRDRMCVRVPPHLGHPGDEAAVRMLALNPDRRVVVAADGTSWYLWPVHHESDAAPTSLAASRTVRALPEGGRARTLSLPEGLALGQLTDREILDLLS